MSGFEREELQARMQGMTKEEQALVAEILPAEIIWNEMYRRFMKLNGQVNDISQRLGVKP